jgi:hypothetical protein
MPSLAYRLFGYWIRRDACRLAATAAQGQCGDGPVAERLWSLTVFFENYLWEGAEGTRDDFGYKEPVTSRRQGGE